MDCDLREWRPDGSSRPVTCLARLWCFCSGFCYLFFFALEKKMYQRTNLPIKSRKCEWSPMEWAPCEPGLLTLLCMFVPMYVKTGSSPVWEVLKDYYSSSPLLRGSRYGHSCSDRTDVSVGVAALLMSHGPVQEARGLNWLNISWSGDKTKRTHSLHWPVDCSTTEMLKEYLYLCYKAAWSCSWGQWLHNNIADTRVHAITGGNDCCGVCEP